ncbi:UDP-N-acetylmuramate--L-alanine ligase [Falsiroseomonas selenitidurans]|uniref:UDP-N-acetylmuramate--L-alanine ligase n=1 Tax=Falsiroseomonas selenitidurans TaxID=2716335 RepID=UPI00143971D6|nr:UDP-N-acetylmuramate--L-alanine ligase [Falsiroseomonas selenitidurans]
MHHHLVGIGGVGMAPLAQLLVEAGHRVSGSDLQDGPALHGLRALGVRVTLGHEAGALAGADVVVASPAIPWRNPELAAARGAGVPVRSRAEALAGLLQGRMVIAVLGSHGKTTTTAMLAAILDRAGLAPGFMVGGIAPSLSGATARLGQGAPFVLEACEAFRALQHWQPSHCLVTNIDDEHSDHYGGHDRLRAAFAALLERVPAAGVIALCQDDHGVVTLGARPAARLVRYGLSAGTALQADQVRALPGGSGFRLVRDGVPLGKVQLGVPGQHNIRNALGALAVALELGVSFAAAAAALQGFTGVRQRWERVGEAGGIRVFHDCAHHPTEIEATLAVARSRLAQRGTGRLVVALRPQLHSRVARLADAFAAALAAAALVLLLPVDGAGEVTAGQDGDARLEAALRAAAMPFRRLPGVAALPAAARACLQAGDVLVTLGPGDLAEAARRVLDALEPAPPLPVAAAGTTAPPALLHRFFERRAAIAPAAPCIEDDDLVWTYGEIERLANQAARQFIRLGAGPEALVVLHLDRSMRMLVLLLGVLKSGAAWLPIDPRLARETLHGQIAANPAICCVVSDSDWPATGGPVLRLDALWPAILAEDPTPPGCDAGPDNLAYAIFTSGSTGTPKLVGVEHRNIVNLVDYATTALLDAADLRVVPFINSIGFDSAVHQVFSTLTHGGLLLVERDLAGLLQSPRRDRITSLGTTPSVLHRMLDDATLPASLRVIGLGGEVIPESLVAAIGRQGTLRKALNYYGPTETTVYSTVAWLLDPRGPEPVAASGAAAGRVLGRPIANTRVHVVDAAGLPVPVGACGEICIAGAGVARGYLGAPALTAERFGRDPFDPDPRARWYRTGDVGRRLADGRIEFVGRLDNQFKLRGMRVEAEEIEAQIAACPGIRQAAVALLQPEGGEAVLAAFVVAAAGLDLARLRAFLRPLLPDLMIPSRLVLLPEMPITTSGKIDRAALAAMQAPPPPADQEAAPPRNATEARLLGIWQAVLGRQAIGVDDAFTALGGDSLASVRVIGMTEAAFGIRLEADAFTAASSIASLARRVAAAAPAAACAPAADGGLGVTILRRQWMRVASWSGQRREPGSLIVTRNPDGERPGLFWCLQGEEELHALAAGLGEDQPVHGMRSGHLVMRYTPDSLGLLAERYAAEVMALQPEGRIRIGGNCQGGTVARLVARRLQEQGRPIELLVLMELNTIRDVAARVALIFGRDSLFNPYREGTDPDAAFRRAYPAGYTVDLIEGTHGRFFKPPNLDGLVQVLRRRLAPDPG